MPRPDDQPAAKPPVAQSSAADSPAAQPSAAKLPYPELPAVVDLPAIEREVLARWQAGRVFDRSLDQTSAGRPWTFYEGPPTANGKPGVHHVEARVLKDLFPRFKTMQGFHVPRQGGWDCHGLAVEVAVEQELGVSGKKEIEAYGIAQFNARCRESVLRHVDAFAELTERMGYWVDLQHAYRTMDPDYIESVWWSLKVIFERGLLIRDYRISPYCPRCETPLSDHEMGQPDVYRTVSDPSVTVRFPLLTIPDRADPQLSGADLLVWTTTPWTLVSNTAVAVHPGETYVVARNPADSDRVVVAESLAGRVLGEGWEVVARFLGADLAGATYRPPFRLVHIPGTRQVITGAFVTTEDGTGLVHLAPAFGPEDMEAARAHGLPVVNPIRGDGRFEDTVPLVGGMYYKDADPTLLSDLEDRGLLFRSQLYEHSYPHCWRCHTPLIYYAQPSWFIRTTAVKDQMLAENEKTSWHPETIKHGRYGEWLRNNVDWALSRTRYWGTPLPLWECPQQHVTCVGSLSELSELADRDLAGLDPHRPYVDEVVLACRQCGSQARRVPEVIDAWYDSGSMPFARLGAPLRNEAAFQRTFPAQFICEGIDQTRGWFYSLMAVSTLVFGRSSYETVVCLGLVVDEHGRKMSKHLGNILEPIPLMDAHGADALRWFFAASGSPWATRRVEHATLEEIVRKVLLTYWNTMSFLVLYANAGAAAAPDGDPGARRPEAPPTAQRPVLDRWLLSELNLLVRDVTTALEEFDSATAGRRIAAFIDEASNWYVRRSRRRFWEGPGTADGAAAFATLHECLETLTRLMAPITPFLADYVWGVLRTEGSPDSVHLASWPTADTALIDDRLSAQMALVRRLVELGRSARASAAVRVRQPLPRALIGAAGFAELPGGLRDQIADELNVRELDTLAAVPEGLVDYTVKPSYRALGRRFGQGTPAVAGAIEAADAAGLAAELRSGGVASVIADGAPVALGPEDVIVTQVPRSGWAVASAGSETVALETAITPELRREGLAREVVRLVQDARKSDGLDVSDRISLRWSTADPELAAAMTEHGTMISGEVLAVDYGPGTADRAGPDAREHDDAGLGLVFWLRRAEPGA
jgi:isoleucyl-tRNA synthetase